MRSRAARIVVALAMAGSVSACGLSDEVLFKTFTGEAPAPEGSTIKQSQVLALGAPAPALGQGVFEPAPVAAGATSDHEAGRAVALLRLSFMDLRTRLRLHDDELQLLRRSLTVDINGFRSAVTKLGLSTGDDVPANDAAFAAQADDMRRRLNRIYADLLKLNGLASKVTVVAAMAAEQLTQAQALAARPDLGAPDRRQLAVLEREIDAAVTLAHGFLSELHLDIGKQTIYASEQRVHLATLIDQVATTDPSGPVRAIDDDRAAPPKSEGDSDAESDTDSDAAMVSPPALPPGRPLVTIRFDRPEVPYAEPLYDAVRAAIARRADAAFEIVGVSPLGANGAVTSAAMLHALDVQRTLTEMGVPEDRLRLASAVSEDTTDDEVRVFVRAADRDHDGTAAGHAVAAVVAPEAAGQAAGPAPDRLAEVAPAAGAPRPLVTIRFDGAAGADGAYEDVLRRALEAALDRRPGAHFDLVGIAAARPDPASGASQALARADAVVETLAAMGLPRGRLTVEASTRPDPGPDTVLIFVR